MSFEKKAITKENLNLFLNELAKAFRKLNGTKMPAEIVLIGGASALANYGFRAATYDIDAIILASSAMKDAIRQVSDKLELQSDWLNTDFMQTDSYTPKLVEVSQYYRTFSNVLTVRTVNAAYLVAMKMRAARQYKHDLSDIIGIIGAQKEMGKPLTLNEVVAAYSTLYGDVNTIDSAVMELTRQALEADDCAALYAGCMADEAENKEVLQRFEEKYPKVLKQENLTDVLNDLKRKKQQTKNNQEKER